ncbi:glucosaminidase domain-containing protein [Flavobacterium rhizosphaerae]|uniref:Peptidoglycan hydrolase n=1 Tax=Flavobacterium rhizosphaerae TaxID=3163298 RepID=A0ABW8YWV2_9FLAO
MLKKILAFVLLSFIVSCGTTKSRVKTKGRTASAKTSKHQRTSKIKTNKGQTATAAARPAANNRQEEVLESTSRTVVYSDIVNQYIDQYKDVAKDNMRRHGIPASITLAQGILESGAGRGTLCVEANNHFGIKCHSDWAGDKIYHDDDAEQECFRKYRHASESFDDHSIFLTTRGRYASLFKLDKDDYKAWAKGLRAAGYATDPKYPEKLIGLIERYELDKYDSEVLNKRYTPAPKTEPAVASNQNSVLQATKNNSDTVAANGSYTVMKGDTLYSISKKHNLTVEQLMKLNGLSGNTISIGQVLKVK